MTKKIKVKTITINNNENMTEWKENESYLHMKFDVLNGTFIFQLLTVRTYDGNAETHEKNPNKFVIMPFWMSVLMTELPKKNENKNNKYVIMK